MKQCSAGAVAEQDLLNLLDQIRQERRRAQHGSPTGAEKRAEARLLMAHPGVGPVTVLAFVLIVGDPERFRCGKQIGSYIGLIPEEASIGVRRRLGHISKQGSTLLRFLLVEAAQAAVRFDADWRNKVLTPGCAAWSSDRESSHGAETRG
jgi:transposase